VSVAPAPFVFGKLPSHGDFVSRGLSAAERDGWDAWASRGLDLAATALGDAFPDAYATAPPWRFVLPDAGGWRAGAFAPSVDRSGRRFPVIAGFAVADPVDLALEPLAERAEEAIYAAMAAGEDVDGLLDRLAGAAPPPADRPPRSTAWTLGGARHDPVTMEGAGRDPALLVAALTPSALEPAL
jgi:type VI secretion system ImpM family protein